LLPPLVANGLVANGLTDSFKRAEQEISELLTDAEYVAHEAIIGTETAVDEIPSIIKAYEESLKARFTIERPGKYSSTEAQVVTTLDESDYTAQRITHTEEVLKNLFPDINALPRVGFCGSGGGIRAMYETLGSLSALEQLGLLDTIIYASGLSGSTWALNPWVASQKSVKEYTKDLMPTLTLTLADHVKNMTSEELYDLLVVLGRTYYNKRELSFIDMYGALTSHLFFKK